MMRTSPSEKQPSNPSWNSLFDFMNNNSFCTFITFDNQEMSTSHINLIKKDEVFFGHLSAANPQAKKLQEGSTVLAVFNNQNNAPKAVHLHGHVQLIKNEGELAENLDKLINKYESHRSPSWTIDWRDDRFKQQMKGILGFYVTPYKIEEAIHSAENNSSPIKVDGMKTLKTTPIYTPRHFQEKRTEILHEFVSTQQSCIIITRTDGDLINVYHAHLSASPSTNNPDQIRLSGNIITTSETSYKTGDTLQTLILLNGAHTYISPTWYKTPHSVPTWNYATIHAYGEMRITALDQSDSKTTLTIEFESTRLDGKYKLNQNRTSEDRKGVMAGLAHSTDNNDQEVRKLMERFSNF